MVAPAEHDHFRRGQQDVEMWLNIMCQRCVHGREEGGQAGIGCRLPLSAFAEPDVDVPEWVRQPGAPFALRCVEKTLRPTKPREKRREAAGQLSLLGGQ